jgi:threonine/homoserine/homoserine lactone efflux protein
MTEERTHGLVGLALAIAAGIVMGALAVSAVFFVLGAIFHVVSWLFHAAVIVGVVALVWWLVVGRRRSHSPAP